MKLLIKPPAEEDADQHGYDDDPAQNTDLGEAMSDRGITVSLPAPVTFRAALDTLKQQVLFGFGHAKSADLPGRRWLTI
jgi:hypothetical protein